MFPSGRKAHAGALVYRGDHPSWSQRNKESPWSTTVHIEMNIAVFSVHRLFPVKTCAPDSLIERSRLPFEVFRVGDFLKETFYNPSEKEYSSSRNEQIGDRISSFIISAVAGAMKSINQS